MNIRLLFALIFTLLLPSLALAEIKPQAVTVTLGGGYIFFAPKRDLKNTAVPTYAALAYNFDEKWAMEIAANLVNANSHNPNNQFVHGFLYLWDEIYRLPTYHRIDSYLLGGFNIFSLKPVNRQVVNQGGINLGVGAQFFKCKAIALSAEARDVYTFSGGKNDILLNAGINFIWE
jgi:hypothetical protein